MNKMWFVAVVPGVLTLVAVVFILMLFLVKVFWAWVIPDLFPGAVAQGLVAGTISWYTAIKVAISFAVISALLGGANRRGS